MRRITEDILYGKFNHLRHKCPSDITDLVFLEIEKDYVARYNHLASESTPEALNKVIGKYIKSYWHLKNIGTCDEPKSKLLKVYTKHSN
ncbi:MAG: hypothetical protein WCK13_01960 [Ignavibacteriota bacterium]|nr:hypothetical protein [Ignavibacteriota bacterium]